jgi:polar amino acid transport system substrate-binding protein
MIVASVPAGAATKQPGSTLIGGWFGWQPYEFEIEEGGRRILKGLDIELCRAVLKRAGYDVEFVKEPDRASHLLRLQSGEWDFTTSPRTSERERYGLFSAPIRREVNVLYVRRSEGRRYRFSGVQGLVEMLEAESFRIGIVRGFDYGPETLRRYLDDREGSERVRAVDGAATLFQQLLDGEVDGFVIDRLVGATWAWEHGLQSRFDVLQMPDETSYDIRLMFSARTVSPEVVGAVDRGLAELEQSGAYQRIVRGYAFPVLLSITVGSAWFLAIDLLGTVAFAVSGVLLARKERYNLIGALVLAALPAVGGGLIRDLIVDRVPVGVMRTPAYLLAVVVTVAAGYAVFNLSGLWRRDPALEQPQGAADAARGRRLTALNNLYLVSDAIGLAAFTVIGVVVAVEARAEPLLLWGPLLAVLTSSGGGVLRDVVRADPANPILKTSLYAEIALLWGLAFAVFIEWQTDRLDPDTVFLGVMTTLIGVLGTRLVTLSFRIQSPTY